MTVWASSAHGMGKKKFHNIHYFHQLHKFSDNQHEREPWGQKADGPWATSEETAYPWPLARSIAAQVVLQLQSRGIVCHLPSFAEQEATFQAMRASTNIQPRKHLPSFAPEFKEVVHQDSQESLPANARFLSTPKRGYVASAKEVKEGQVTAGVHFSPEEFVAEAVRLGHPAVCHAMSFCAACAGTADLRQPPCTLWCRLRAAGRRHARATAAYPQTVSWPPLPFSPTNTNHFFIKTL